jgi:hypothetical protein
MRPGCKTFAYSTALLTAFGSPCHSRPEGQRFGNQIDAAFAFARSDFVNVHFSPSRLNKGLGEIVGNIP